MKVPKIQPIKTRVKRPEIVESLTRLARQLGPTTRLPRTRELSKALGVTLATLDHGLRQLEERGLIERRPRSGIFVSPRILQRTVGMVLGSDIFSTKESAFYSILLDRCAKRAASLRERFSFYLDLPTPASTENQSLAHQDLVDALGAKKLDGLLVASLLGGDQEKWLRSQGIPTVCLNFGGSPGSVVVDTAALVRMAAEELKKSGCETIAFMAPVSPHIEYFRQTAAELGFLCDESWIFAELPEGDHSREAVGAIFARRMLEQAGPSRENLPQGLIITDDILARGALPYFSTHHVAIGKDLKIASHCNKGSLVLAEWESVLIQCQFDPEDVAEAMFAMLETLMDGGRLAEEEVHIPPHLRTGS